MRSQFVRRLSRGAGLPLLALGLMTSPAGAQQGATAAEDTVPAKDAPARSYELEALEVVSATRSGTPVAAIPGAVSVVSQKELEEGRTVTRGLGELLGRSVPGLAVGTQSMSNHGQSLRGRSVVVLIDGVPQSTLRNVSRDFVNIDPAMIERVEVLRGATAIYGDGATGGVINIVTRSPVRGETRFHTEVSTGGSLSSVGDGLGGRVSQGVSGTRGAFEFALTGAWERATGFYDAEGDLIPSDPHGQGGLADTESRDLFGKLGFRSGAQRLQLTANVFRSMQDSDFTADPAVNQLPAGTAKARALPGLVEEEPQGTENTLVSLDYHHDDLLGSRVHGQLYHRDYMTRFRGFDRRRYDRKTGEWTSGQVGQSFIDSEKWGGRLEVDSRFLGEDGPSLLWGADYTYENTSQLMSIMDPAVYDASGGLEFRKVGERVWVPPLRPGSLGLFAQLGWSVTDDLLLRGGVRRERIRMHVDDFVTLDDNQVYGGDLAYDPTLFNVGAVYNATSAVNVYGNFSQGFSLADVGRILRAAKDGFDLGKNRLDAQRVDHYEVGVRGTWPRVESSLSTFYNHSALGTLLRLNNDGMLEVTRAPERVYGVEGSLELHPTDRLSLGGVASWTEGDSYEKQPAVADSAWTPLNGYRIQPMKLTGYVEHRTLPGWSTRLQVLHSGDRRRAYEAYLERLAVNPNERIYGQPAMESFTVVDLLSSVEAGPGTLRFGVENLLNRQYFDIVSQLDIPDGNQYYTAARGRSLSVGYSVSY